jgi:hypothetical protein
LDFNQQVSAVPGAQTKNPKPAGLGRGEKSEF